MSAQIIEPKIELPFDDIPSMRRKRKLSDAKSSCVWSKTSSGVWPLSAISSARKPLVWYSSKPVCSHLVCLARAGAPEDLQGEELAKDVLVLEAQRPTLFDLPEDGGCSILDQSERVLDIVYRRAIRPRATVEALAYGRRPWSK